MNALVYMNHGRWVVDCPREDCAWAHLAMTPEGRPRYQLRCECGDRIDLCWPPLDAALEIERLLFARPVSANRNWRAPETVDGLDAENQNLLVGWTLQMLADAGIGVEA